MEMQRLAAFINVKGYVSDLRNDGRRHRSSDVGQTHFATGVAVGEFMPQLDEPHAGFRESSGEQALTTRS
jgi:hypothetical protein